MIYPIYKGVLKSYCLCFPNFGIFLIIWRTFQHPPPYIFKCGPCFCISKKRRKKTKNVNKLFYFIILILNVILNHNNFKCNLQLWLDVFCFWKCNCMKQIGICNLMFTSWIQCIQKLLSMNVCHVYFNLSIFFAFFFFFSLNRSHFRV